MADVPSRHARARHLLGIVVLAVFVGLALVLGWRYVERLDARPMSEDAVLTASVARMAASVPGRVKVLAVAENAKVSKGDLLFAIDPEFYQLQVEQARAGTKVTGAALDTRGRTVSAESSDATIASEQLQRARINLAQATQTLDRLLRVEPKGYVTKQQVEDARTLKLNAETSLKEAQAQLGAAKVLVGNTSGASAAVEQSRVALAIAERELRETEVRAPNDGRVVGLSIAQGDFVLPGQSAFTLIDTTRWYASADFLETELGAVRPGSCATVYVAADRSRTIAGVVESIGWGVASEVQIPIPRSLPYVPKSLNWVRVGQRFPVRVLLKDPPEDLMRMGASATVIVQHDSKC